MAPVGRRPGAGRNVIYLKQTKQEDSCFSRHQLYHTLFHVLGLYHEHNRSDRDKYITIYEKNLKRNYYVRIFSWELMQINDESLRIQNDQLFTHRKSRIIGKFHILGLADTHLQTQGKFPILPFIHCIFFFFFPYELDNII